MPLTAQMAADLVAGGLGNSAHRDDEATGRSIPVPFRSVERVRIELALEERGLETRLRIRARTVGSYGDEARSTRLETTFQGEVEPSLRSFLYPGLYLDDKAQKLRKPISLPKPETEDPKRSTSFTEALEQLAGRLSYPIVADGYWHGSLHGPLVADGKPLAQVLERVCRIFGRRCRFERGYLRFRHAEWANRRAVEPPARRMQRWEEALRRDAALSFRDLVEIGGSLTPEQAEVLLSRWDTPEMDGFASLLEADLEQSGPVLRLLHSLPPHTLTALEAGRPVPVGRLPPVALRHVRRACAEAAVLIAGAEGRPGEEGQPFVPGRGFEEEDRLEAAWLRGVLRLGRAPAKWIFAGDRWFPLEEAAEALEWARVLNPKATERDLKRVSGEMVQVQLQVPAAAPVTHFFLVSLPERREK